MRPWHIEWTQTTNGKEEHITGAFVAETTELAIAQWAMQARGNAQIDAVYDPLKFRSKRLGEKVADPASGGGQAAAGGEEVKEDWLDMPRGVKLQRFVAADRSVTFMGQYVNREGTPNDAPCRLYRVEVRPQLIEGGWAVAIFEDNKRVWSAKANTSRYCAEYTAVKMLKCLFKYKLRNCDKRRRTRDSKRNRKAVAV